MKIKNEKKVNLNDLKAKNFSILSANQTKQVQGGANTPAINDFTLGMGW